MRTDAIDIYHGNTVTDWDAIGPLPGGIWHKANEGTAFDTRFAGRMPEISARFERFGAYTVPFPPRPGWSSLRRQVELFAKRVEPWWHLNMGGMLDVESWHDGSGYRYGRPLTADEVDELVAHFVELLGRRPMVYWNRNEPGAMGPFTEWRRRNPTHPYWMPGYSGARSVRDAIELGADVHQWTASGAPSGFRAPIDCNEIRNMAAVLEVCGETTERDYTMRTIPPGTRPRYDSRTAGGGPLERLRVHRIPNVAPAGVAGATVNVTITQPRARGWAMVWGDGPPPDPGTSSAVNFDAGQTIANAVTVPVAADGSVHIYLTAAAHVVMECQAVLA